VNLGAIRQFEGLRNRRFFPAHLTLTDCYCHRCFCDFMVSSGQAEHDRVDKVVMHYLFELGADEL
jgi:hypothetical protein